jgi:hypothetical protein
VNAAGPGPGPGLEAFVAAAPQPQRAALSMLLALACRPRGKALLHRFAPADQLAHGLAAMGRFEDPGVAVKLGWDADAIAARGRALRREEARP